MQLVRCDKDVLTIFDLFGSKENDMTFSLGWLLSKSEVFLRVFLKDVLGDVEEDVKSAVIKLQTGRGSDGITDIEITVSDQVFVIIEAKKGPELPTPEQLGKYAKTLKKSLQARRHLVALTNATTAAAHGTLKCAGISTSNLHHRSWRQIRQLSKQAIAVERSNENKKWLRMFSEYIGGLLGMEMKYSNRVFVVSIGGQPADWTISFKEIVEKRKQYFFPVGDHWPDPPPNYIGFRYDGELKSIHHVKKFRTFERPHELFPEAPKNQVWRLHYCLELGPAIYPSRKTPTGPRILRANKVWCFLDTLLTCKTISDALTETKKREGNDH